MELNKIILITAVIIFNCFEITVANNNVSNLLAVNHSSSINNPESSLLHPLDRNAPASNASIRLVTCRIISAKRVKPENPPGANVERCHDGKTLEGSGFWNAPLRIVYLQIQFDKVYELSHFEYVIEGLTVHDPWAMEFWFYNNAQLKVGGFYNLPDGGGWRTVGPYYTTSFSTKTTNILEVKIICHSDYQVLLPEITFYGLEAGSTCRYLLPRSYWYLSCASELSPHNPCLFTYLNCRRNNNSYQKTYNYELTKPCRLENNDGSLYCK